MMTGPVVDAAVYDIRRFGGQNTDRVTAQILLSLWRCYDQVTWHARAAILAAFPPPAEPEPVAGKDFLPEHLGEISFLPEHLGEFPPLANFGRAVR